MNMERYPWPHPDPAQNLGPAQSLDYASSRFWPGLLHAIWGA